MANHVLSIVLVAVIAGFAIGWLVHDYIGSEEDNLRDDLWRKKDLW